MFEYVKRNRRFCEDGVELLRFRASYPNFKGGGIGAFYEEMADNCLKYCENSLFPKIKQAYDDDPDEKKRFGFNKYTYELNAAVVYVARDTASVRVDVRLTGRAGKKSRVLVQNFRISNGALICPDTAAKSLAPRVSKREIKRLLARSESLLFSEREIFCLKKGALTSAAEEVAGANRRKKPSGRGEKSSKAVVNNQLI